MTQAKTGVGTEIRLGDGASPEVFTKIAEVRSISGPSVSVEQVEATSLDSTGGFKEFIAGLRDGGEVSFPCNWFKETQQQALITASDAGTAKNFRIVSTDGGSSQFDFTALITGYNFNWAANDPIQAEFTLKMTGALTLT